MSCFNFIIMKVNGADVSNLPYEEAVQLFLNAEEPILVEVRRRCFDETNKLSFFNYDTHKSPTLAVIASSNPPNLRDEVDFCGLSEEANSSLKTLKDSSDKKPAISTTSCQTDLSAFDSESKEILFIKEEEATDNGTFFRRKQELATTNVNTIDGCLRTEFDIEEITLRKSQSTENLGFTISYSTEDYSGTESGSDECVDDSNDGNGRHEGEFDFNDFNAAYGCKIYVSDIVPNSLADRDGRLHQGDRILQINGQNVLEKVDPNKLLMENKHSVTMLVSRYAYAGEDDFLDSAVYCDDKECQDDRHLASICECEQNTFSSKSSLSQPDPNSCAAIADSTVLPILPIAVEKVSELFSHANIKSQLESVNKEISLLNSQISIMKLQQCQMEHHATTDKDTTLIKWREKPTTQSTKIQTPERQVKQKLVEPEVEHIYETIPEDTESDAYYCSPYEGVNDLRVEQWLTSIGCTKSHIQRIHFGAAGDKTQTDATGTSPAPSRLPKHNPILDDYDNSSSAYNTGGSCNSALLALDQQSKPTSNQVGRHHSRKLSAKCKNTFHVLSRLNNTEASIHYQQPSERSRLSTCIGGQTPVPSTPVPVTNPCHTDAESDGHSTLVARSSICRRYQYKTIDENKDESTAETVWKVKRRPDGTRYIVRRVTRKQPATDCSNEQANSQDSAAYIDYKRQAQKVKDRRHRNRNAPTPSKEKHHAQHWLV